jgi:hypothetical protein
METSAVAPTLVEAVEELLPGVGSDTADETVAVFEIVPVKAAPTV